MSDNNDNSADRSKRRLVGTLTVTGTAAGAAKFAPDRWTSPLVDAVLVPAHAQASPGDLAATSCSGILEGEGPAGGLDFPDNTQTLSDGSNTISDFYSLFRPDFLGSGSTGAPPARFGSLQAVISPAPPAGQDVDLQAEVISGSDLTVATAMQTEPTDASGVATFAAVEISPNEFGPPGDTSDTPVGTDHTFRLTFSSEGAEDCVIEIALDLSAPT